MNKQELIKHFEEMEYVSIHQMGKKAFIDLIEQLDEPQRQVVPQIVADYIKYTKDAEWDLQEAMDNVAYEDNKDLRKWFNNNIELFARAWLDGYTVEKEKRYLVKVIGVGELYEYLNFDTTENRWKFFDRDNTKTYRTHHTRKELEEGGFGWIFSCEGIEVEEVE